MKLSIIIPVYNAQKTLEACIESILRQRYDDCEIIIVNDGSTDNSETISSRFAANNNRIKVFTKANEGPGFARNYGIEKATGDYLTFIDSDDTIAENTLVPLMSLLQENGDWDILEYPVKERAGHPTESLFMPEETIYRTCKEWLCDHGFCHFWSCNKIFKRELWVEVRYPQQMVYEDMQAISDILKSNPTIAFTRKGLYVYNWYGTNLTATMDHNKAYNLLCTQIEVAEKLGVDITEKGSEKVYMDMLSAQLHTDIKRKEPLLKRRWLNPLSFNDKASIVKALTIDLFGVNLTCRLFQALR